ncbi:hypothetical protein [Streptobacillus moniliformis]|uniref:hypothetical protein n=1 Tax=Streptobacillus moniliformis TaxID=34105 RepID=UPI0007E40E0B|nr:hypothetical protein [Streptobacillus moniliformis]
MKLTVTNVAKELDMMPMKLAYSIRTGLFKFAVAIKKTKSKYGRYTYYFDPLATNEYIERYKEKKKKNESE